jgi:O-antigen/teichoic acid export membrane protein
LLQYLLLWSAARTLSQADFGDFTFALSAGFMLAQVADFGLQLYVQRELARLAIAGAVARPYFSDEQAAGKLVGGGLTLKGMLSVVAMLLITTMVLVEPVGNKAALLLIGVSLVLGTALDYLSYCFRAIGRLGYEAAANLISRTVNLTVGVSLLLLGAEVWGLALAGNVAMLVALAFGFVRLTRFMRPLWRPDWKYWRRSMAQPTALGIGIIFSIVSFRVDNLLIAPIAGSEGLAVYNLAYKLFEPSLIVPGVVLAATFPLLSQAAGVVSVAARTLRRLLARTLGGLTLLGAAATILLIVLASPVVSLLYGQEYMASVPVLQLLALACLPMYINYGLTHTLVAIDKPRYYAAFTLATLVVNVAANLLLIPAMGIEGAAVATAVTEVVLFALCGFTVWRYLSRATSRAQADEDVSAAEAPRYDGAGQPRRTEVGVEHSAESRP